MELLFLCCEWETEVVCPSMGVTEVGIIVVLQQRKRPLGALS